MHLKPKAGALLLALTAALLTAPVARATQPVAKNLTQLLAGADQVVAGSVVAVSDGLNEHGVPYTEVRLKLRSSLRKKLEPGSEFSFRQWGLLAPRRMPDGRFLLPMQVEGMPRWSVGEEVLVFLNPPATATGLRSPVGLNQGKFSAVGGRMRNGQNNLGLFNEVQVNASLPAAEAEMLKQFSGPVPELDLINLVTRAIEGQWVETGVMR